METAPLKSFATWARTTLIGEVTARIAVVLAPGSFVRVERSNVVTALEKAVESAGGGELGRAAVADKVAYTWFNRIIALRFMDANGYTGIGVVSPERGRDNGQPEILAEAKRGNIDSDVINNQYIVETLTSLLNGTRRSEDPQGEAFSLLLANYCQFWNRSMPFMFERESDFTELLMPANLLADDSVIARAVTVLTEKVCQDVEVIGWLYQFYISERKTEVFAGFKKNKKAGAAEIPAATQLFTPHWIVRYLVENSVGRLWLLNRPTSRLADQMEYYIAPVDEETTFLKISGPKELKIIDPACGSGHMLTYAFDLLYAIYEEEGYAPFDIPGLILANNLYGTEIDPRAGALAAFALTMKARACQRTFFTRQVKPNICALESISFTPGELGALATRDGDHANEQQFWNQFENVDTFGALISPRKELVEQLRQHLDIHEPDKRDIIGNELYKRARNVIRQATYLSSHYHTVVANPPYMSSASMDSRLAQFAKETFPQSWSDLFAMFIERNLSFVEPGGSVGMITMQSWMYLASFENLRNRILRETSIDSLIHLGAGAFSTIGGSVVSTCAFVIRSHSDAGSLGRFINLTGPVGEFAKASALREGSQDGTLKSYYVSPREFDMVPGAPIAYDLEERIVFQRENLRSLFSSGGRLKTHGNARYVRFFWEVVENSNRWRPLSNGGTRAAFYGNDEEIVDWSASAQQHYEEHGGMPKPESLDRIGITWTLVGSATGSFRLREADSIHSSGSPTIFGSSSASTWAYLGALNSKAAGKLLEAINPTINTGVGNVISLPRLDESYIDSLSKHSLKAYSLRIREHETLETSPKFVAPKFLQGNQSRSIHLGTRFSEARETTHLLKEDYLSTLQEIDEIVNADLAFTSSEHRELDPVASSAWNADLAGDLVSYAVGCMLGRYSIESPGLILANQGDTLQDYLAKVPNPTFMPDADNVIPIVDGDWFEDDIVTLFRQFLRAAFGEQHFEENLRFVIESLGVQDLRDYFVKSFYKDHVQRYKKRPIYWLFSSPKGSFNALIYMHRYTSSTVSTVLNEYLREFKAKLAASRQHHERLAAGTGTTRDKAAAQKEVDRLRKVLLELDEYEHDVLYPLATQQIQIDLDDGVKANYPKFGTALKKIVGLEAKDD